jgi:hypothetical protein
MSATTIYAHVSDQVKLHAAAKLPHVDITKRYKQPLRKVEIAKPQPLKKVA